MPLFVPSFLLFISNHNSGFKSLPLSSLARFYFFRYKNNYKTTEYLVWWVGQIAQCQPGTGKLKILGILSLSGGGGVILFKYCFKQRLLFFRIIDMQLDTKFKLSQLFWTLLGVCCVMSRSSRSKILSSHNDVKLTQI